MRHRDAHGILLRWRGCGLPSGFFRAMFAKHMGDHRRGTAIGNPLPHQARPGKKTVLPSAEAASASLLKCPSMAVSVARMIICASWVAASGTARREQFTRFRGPNAVMASRDGRAGRGGIGGRYPLGGATRASCRSSIARRSCWNTSRLARSRATLSKVGRGENTQHCAPGRRRAQAGEHAGGFFRGHCAGL